MVRIKVNLALPLWPDEENGPATPLDHVLDAVLLIAFLLVLIQL